MTPTPVILSNPAGHYLWIGADDEKDQIAPNPGDQYVADDIGAIYHCLSFGSGWTLILPAAVGGASGDFPLAGGQGGRGDDDYAYRWGLPGWFISQAGGNTNSNGNLFAFLFCVSGTRSYDRIGVKVATLEAGKKIRLGIYEHDAENRWPGALILDAGTIDVSTAGNKEIVIDQRLTAGYYFLAWVGDGSTYRLQGASDLGISGPISSGHWSAGSMSGKAGARIDGQSAAVAGGLPDPFPIVGKKVIDFLRMATLLREA